MKNKLTLQDVEWKEFKIKEIFDVFTGSLLNKELLKFGKLPRITATDLDNGIALFTDDISNNKFRKYKNFISISFLGSVFYQENNVSLDMKIHGIKIKDIELNKNIALFLIPMIKNFTFKFSYGYQLSTSMLKIQKLMLPIDKNGNPNWQFMEDYIKQEEKEIVNKVVKYYQNRLDEILKNAAEGGQTLKYIKHKNIKWREFFIGSTEGIFDIQSTSSGVDKNKLNTETGNIPYITRSDIVNGINLFICKEQDKKYKLDDGNVITIGLDTQTVFYQKNSFYTGQNIQVLRKHNLNKEIALFIIPLLKIQMEKFNWGGNGATLRRLNRTKIMLPIDKNGEPDWRFMENYIKQKELKNIIKLISYYKNKEHKICS
ncbi:restriction endonuclease subunit S [Campylobacter pinnipediorum]|uniref:restriction endonuclease subunit S n=1 Tax=Campylobacter pinnipediorum TaxID=1965231 RepID=UPI00084D3EF4|nr:restriction endonuclease subunit S [Campylobacter pinnipediorum]